MKRLFLIAAIKFLAAAAFAAPAVIYVDQNAAAGGNGSAGAPFQTILEGIDALALSNAVETGGHTISVASGRYMEMVYVYSNAHAGTPSAPNTLIGVGNPVIDAEGVRQYGVHIHMATNFVVKGFHITGATFHGVLLNNNNGSPAAIENWTLDSCWIYGNSIYGVATSRHFMEDLVFTNCVFAYNVSHGIYLQSITMADIMNCAFVGNGGAGYYGQYGSSIINIRNSVFVGNGLYGVWEDSHDVRMSYSLLYGNGRGNFFDVTYGRGPLNTAGEINSLDDCSNNIVANPGYVSLNPFNPQQVYQPTPLVNAGDGGVDIGIHGLIADTPVSSNVYYVATTGSDAYNKAQAQNPDTPWKTIQHVSANMTAGDTARVAAGEYVENVLITNTSVEGFSVKYVADAGAVLNAGGSPNYGFNVQYANEIMISGFEIKNFGRGVNIENSFACSIHESSIHADSGNSAVYGINIESGANGAHDIVGCDIYGNGYGLRCVGDGVTVWNSDLRDNAFDGVLLGGNARFSFRMYNCNVFSNRYGIQLSTYGGVTAYNCNIVNNRERGLSFNSTVTSAEMWNCNIAGNGDYGVYEHVSYYSKLYYCNFHDHAIAHLRNKNSVNYLDVNAINTVADPTANYSNNISVNPMFRDAANGDFKLMGGSLCVDAGTTTTELETDYYGNPRLVGPAVDIGVYEMPPSGMVIRFY